MQNKYFRNWKFYCTMVRKNFVLCHHVVQVMDAWRSYSDISSSTLRKRNFMYYKLFLNFPIVKLYFIWQMLKQLMETEEAVPRRRWSLMETRARSVHSDPSRPSLWTEWPWLSVSLGPQESPKMVCTPAIVIKDNTKQQIRMMKKFQAHV